MKISAEDICHILPVIFIVSAMVKHLMDIAAHVSNSVCFHRKMGLLLHHSLSIPPGSP